MTDKVGGWGKGEEGRGEGGGGEGEHSPVCSMTNKVGGGCATTGHGNTVHTQDQELMSGEAAKERVTPVPSKS